MSTDSTKDILNCKNLTRILLAPFKAKLNQRCLTSIPAWGDTHRAETNHGYFDFRATKTSCTNCDFHSCCTKCELLTLLNTRDPSHLENYDRIAAVSPDLRRVSFHGITELLHHSTTIELFSPFKLIEGFDPSLRVPPRCLEDVISNLSHVV